MRLIDADALIQLLCVNMDTGKQFYRATHCVDEMPTVDFMPERDIPKAPTDQQLEEDGYGAWGSVYGHCPNCKGTVYDEQNYCEKCGQRLNWGIGDPNGFKEETVQAMKDATEGKNLSKVYETLDDMYADMEIDCVPVIRCRECRYWNYEDSGVDGTSVGECCWMHMLSEGTFYCAGAERREDAVD